MELKHLFPNFDLAEMIVKNWEYDSLELFKYWRISSNAIYPFSNNEKVYFLRIAPADENSEAAILAELEFLSYLKGSDYAAIQACPSRKGRELEIVNTPWGQYYAAVFKRVSGESLDDIEVTDDIAFLWGRSLGRLHRLSSRYKPDHRMRNSWKDQIRWIKEVLEDFPEETEAVREADVIKGFLESIDITEDNYGLIHYDFETDNVFYDKDSNKIIPIDFDDSMYHWYAMDIEQALDSIRNEIPPERGEMVAKKFMEGYSLEYNISDDMIKLLPVFRRFGDLYAYARVLRSIREKWDNEPEWMEKIRIKLNKKLQEKKSRFGSLIE